MAATKRKAISPATLRRFWGMPCTICGDRDDIEVDHIVPVAKGGTNDESNLQPLCHQCHVRKGNRRARSNAELRAMYLKNPRQHHLLNAYRMATKKMNPYDAPSFDQWWRRVAGEPDGTAQ